MRLRIQTSLVKCIGKTLATMAFATFAVTAHAQNIATVNVVQIFGTIDPAKVNDYTEYMAGVNMYEASSSRMVRRLKLKMLSIR